MEFNNCSYNQRFSGNCSFLLYVHMINNLQLNGKHETYASKFFTIASTDWPQSPKRRDWHEQ